MTNFLQNITSFGSSFFRWEKDEDSKSQLEKLWVNISNIDSEVDTEIESITKKTISIDDFYSKLDILSESPESEWLTDEQIYNYWLDLARQKWIVVEWIDSQEISNTTEIEKQEEVTKKERPSFLDILKKDLWELWDVVTAIPKWIAEWARSFWADISKIQHWTIMDEVLTWKDEKWLEKWFVWNIFKAWLQRESEFSKRKSKLWETWQTWFEEKLEIFWQWAWFISDIFWEVFLSWLKTIATEDQEEAFKSAMNEMLSSEIWQKWIALFKDQAEWFAEFEKQNPRIASLIRTWANFWLLWLDVSWAVLWKQVIEKTSKNLVTKMDDVTKKIIDEVKIWWDKLITKVKETPSKILGKIEESGIKWKWLEEVIIDWKKVLQKTKSQKTIEEISWLLDESLSVPKKSINKTKAAIGAWAKFTKWKLRTDAQITKNYDTILNRLKWEWVKPKDFQTFVDDCVNEMKKLYSRDILPQLKSDAIVDFWDIATDIRKKYVWWDEFKKLMRELGGTADDEKQVLKMIETLEKIWKKWVNEAEEARQFLNKTWSWAADEMSSVQKRILEDVIDMIAEKSDDAIIAAWWEWISELRRTYSAFVQMMPDMQKKLIQIQKAAWVSLPQAIWIISGTWDIVKWLLSKNFKQSIEWMAKLLVWKELRLMKDSDDLIKSAFKELYKWTKFTKEFKWVPWKWSVFKSWWKVSDLPDVKWELKLTPK